MIHRDLAIGADAMVRTLRATPSALPQLIPWLAVGLVICQRELLMHLWRSEEKP